MLCAQMRHELWHSFCPSSTLKSRSMMSSVSRASQPNVSSMSSKMCVPLLFHHLAIDYRFQALDRGFLMAQEHSRRARRLIRKLCELCDKLPSSLFITGVSGREEHPAFRGGFGDVYRASYGNKTVALKYMRYFLRGSELQKIRLVSFQRFRASGVR